jgi:hypothetical protein
MIKILKRWVIKLMSWHPGIRIAYLISEENFKDVNERAIQNALIASEKMGIDKRLKIARNTP